MEQLLNTKEIIGHPVWNLRTKTPKNEATTVPWHQGSFVKCIPNLPFSMFGSYIKSFSHKDSRLIEIFPSYSLTNVENFCWHRSNIVCRCWILGQWFLCCFATNCMDSLFGHKRSKRMHAGLVHFISILTWCLIFQLMQ